MPRPPTTSSAIFIAGFVRGRLSGQPVDVATSDRHTVKPWLAGKIAGATTVVDLKADGFPLVGGRIDVVGQTPVATLVYQRREHQIALSEIPSSAAGGSAEARRQTRDGFSLLEWTDGGRLFVAVSDLPPAELDVFGAAFRRAAVAEREEFAEALRVGRPAAPKARRQAVARCKRQQQSPACESGFSRPTDLCGVRFCEFEVEERAQTGLADLR